MKTIPLTRGMVALVDDDDFLLVGDRKWFAQWCNGLYYAAYSTRIGKKRGLVLMHRVLVSAAKGQRVDHRNGSTLDNRRDNLRLCNQSNNIGNGKMRKNNTSGFKGVIYSKQRPVGKWRAEIMLARRHQHLGYFETPQDAARAYDAKALELFGEFARTNAMLGLL